MRWRRAAAAVAVVASGVVAAALLAQAPGAGAAPQDVPPSCPIDPETGQCLPDRDRDGRTDSLDNCPDHYNPFQEDSDGDGIGNACDPTPNGGGGSGGGGGGGGGGTAACSSSAPVVLYEHNDYQGACWGFWPGEHPVVNGNDQASSIRVAAGYVASLFQHTYFGGAYVNVGDSTSTAWGWTGVGNDAVSSVVVQSLADSQRQSSGVDTDAPSETGLSASTYAYYGTSGCARVGDAVKRLDDAKRTVWVYFLRLSFCWGSGKITSIWARDYGAGISELPRPFRWVAAWYYRGSEFIPGEPGFGYTTVRATGTIEFCGFRYGCILSRQPWISIRLHGDGRALCSSSVNGYARNCYRSSA